MSDQPTTIKEEIDEFAIEAFMMIWGKYPEPAMLVHQSRSLVAVNQACRDFGWQPGNMCARHCSTKVHEECLQKTNSCLADQALAAGQGMCVRKKSGQAEMTVHWLPIKNNPEYYVHFFAGSVTDPDRPKS